MPHTAHILLNEADLFKRLTESDAAAFEIIYRHYVRRLSPFVGKLIRSPEIKQEIIQDIFVHVWVNRHLFVEVKQPTAYLFNTATNKTLDYIKKIANNDKLLHRIAVQSSELTNNTEERINFNESVKLIEEAAATLPDQRRLIYKLSRNDGLTHEQIAARLNISKNTVKNQLVKALKSIKVYLQENATYISLAVFAIISSKR